MEVFRDITFFPSFGVLPTRLESERPQLHSGESLFVATDFVPSERISRWLYLSGLIQCELRVLFRLQLPD